MAEHTGNRSTVLLLDDDPILRMIIASFLEQQGYDCVPVESTAQARAALTTEPSLVAVLCDINLADESGLELLPVLAADFPDLAVVMTTGVDDPMTATEAIELGADAYLVKPFSNSELLVALATGRKRRELEEVRRTELRRLDERLGRLNRLTGALHGVNGSMEGEQVQELTDRLTRALSLRDEETGGHIQRMSRHAALLAGGLGYDPGALDQVRLEAALHDIGKIGVPDSILLKPGPLTDGEAAAMRRHTQMGYQLLAGSSSEVLGTAAAVALCHHEWWDGTGYPQGLRGEQIPEVARIAAVADVFDALTSNRVYRPALPVDEAVRLITDLSGRQFDPRIVSTMLDTLDQAVALRGELPDTDDAQRIRVFVVDDHEMFVTILVRLLGTQPHMKVVGTAGTVAEAIKGATAYEPDVILMDYMLPDGDGISCTKRIRRLLPSAKVVMLTGMSDRGTFLQAIEAGCAGFVAKTEAVDVLINTVQATYDDESFLSEYELSAFLTRLNPTHRGLGANLSNRELEVLRHLASGLSNQQIAERLGISLSSERSHVQEVMYKLDASSRLEAVAVAVRERVIVLPGPLRDPLPT